MRTRRDVAKPLECPKTLNTHNIALGGPSEFPKAAPSGMCRPRKSPLGEILDSSLMARDVDSPLQFDNARPSQSRAFKAEHAVRQLHI